MRAIKITAGVLFLVAACGGPKTGTGTAVGTGTGTSTSTGTATGTQTPPDPATVVDGDVTDAWVNGMHVLIKRIPGAETTATQLYIQGGVRNWGKANAGIEQLAIATATTGGTEAMPKDAFTRKLAELGSTIGGGTTSEFSAIGAWSLVPTWDETFDMMMDTFRRPALPASQLELVRAQQLSGLKHEQEDPDSKLQLIAHAAIYAGHPYEHRSNGTLETVAAATPVQVAAHLASLRETSRLLLVVVGDIDPEHVLEMAHKAVGDLPRGSYQATELPTWTNDKGSLAITDQTLPTNYIRAGVPGPGWKDPAYAVAWVAMRALHNRVWEEVRTKRSLSYAPAAWFANDGPLTSGGLYVTAVDPIATMKVMLDEARKLRDEPVAGKDLEGTKSTLLTGLVSDNEAPEDQARQLAVNQLFAGDWRMARTLPDRIRAVTADQVQTWAKQHLTRLRTFVLGDKTKFDRQALESF
jgi:zinc protease